MSNKEKILWSVFAGVLVLLFLLSSTDLIIKEAKKKIYSVSVIIADTNDDYFTNFRKGMDSAAEKMQADVSFITLYYGNNVYEQIEMVKREMRDGADAIILDPVNEEKILKQLDEISVSCPIVWLGESTESSAISVSLHGNRFEEGKMLAEKALEELSEEDEKDVQIWLITEGLDFSGNQKVYDGAVSVLEEHGLTYQLLESRSKELIRQELIRNTGIGKKPVLFALDTESLDTAAKIAEENPEYEEKICGIYGIGCTMGSLRQMERGRINGAVVRNRYDEGYRSVYYAVMAAEKNQKHEDIEMESFYIESKDLYDPQYEKLLYPIE